MADLKNGVGWVLGLPAERSLTSGLASHWLFWARGGVESYFGWVV